MAPRPFARRAAAAGRAVAAVLLCVLILNAVLIGSVEAYRERAYEIVENVTRKFTAFSVKVNENTPPVEFKPIEPPYVPEGYAVTEKNVSDIAQVILYSDNDGGHISFTQMILTSGSVLFDTEDAVVEDKEILGCEVRVIAENEMVQAYWIDGECEFLLISNAGYDEVLTMSEKILEIFEK